jgi:hypothetical protein
MVSEVRMVVKERCGEGKFWRKARSGGDRISEVHQENRKVQDNIGSKGEG